MDSSNNVENRFSMGALVSGQGVKFVGETDDKSASIKTAKWNERSIKWTVPEGRAGAGQVLDLNRNSTINFLRANMSEAELNGELSKLPFFGPSEERLRELLDKHYSTCKEAANFGITQLSKPKKEDIFNGMSEETIIAKNGKILASSKDENGKPQSGGPMVVLDKATGKIYVTQQPRKAGVASHGGITQSDWNKLLNDATRALANHKPRKNEKTPSHTFRVSTDHQKSHIENWQAKMKGELAKQQWEPKPAEIRREEVVAPRNQPTRTAGGGDIHPSTAGVALSIFGTICEALACLG